MDVKPLNLDCEPLRILVTCTGSQLVVRLIGELDQFCVEPLGQVSELSLDTVCGINVDLSELEFIAPPALIRC